MKEQIREIIKNNDFKYYGIRGVDDQVIKVGDILEESYYWNYDEDRSTRGHDDEEGLGGACATAVKKDMSAHGNWEMGDMFDGIDEMAEGVINAFEWHKENYTYSNVYLVAADYLGDGEPNDDNEIILEDAKVIFKF